MGAIVVVVVGCPNHSLLNDVVVGRSQVQEHSEWLVWLMWPGGKAVGILVAKFHELMWCDGAMVWHDTFTTFEVIDKVRGSIHDGHTFFK